MSELVKTMIEDEDDADDDADGESRPPATKAFHIFDSRRVHDLPPAQPAPLKIHARPRTPPSHVSALVFRRPILPQMMSRRSRCRT